MFKVLTDGCKPTRGTKYSACVDLYASESVIVGTGETKLVGLGVAIDLEGLKESLEFHIEYYKEDEDFENFKKSLYLQLMLRSSLSKELIIANGVGIVDIDYEDEIKIRVHKPIDMFSALNDDYSEVFHIKKGDRIAQITLLEHKSYLFGIDSESERTGGFGSTDNETR